MLVRIEVQIDKFKSQEEYMLTKVFSLQNRVMRRAAGAALVAMALALPAANAHAQASCQMVVGHYVEHAVTEGCTSPVGLCIAGEYNGVIKGAFDGTATSLTPTADTPATAVVLFTSNSMIHARIGGKQGDLIVKNAGAFHTAGEGEIVDMQFITGGTGAMANASGVLRASGTFDLATGMGESEYIGNICLP
jgi:hypothetical protein